MEPPPCPTVKASGSPRLPRGRWACLAGAGRGVDWHWHRAGRQPQAGCSRRSTPRQPHVVVVDSQLQTPPDARLLIAGRVCYIYWCSPNDTAFQARETSPGKPGRRGRGSYRTLITKWTCQQCLQTWPAEERTNCMGRPGTKLNGSSFREGWWMKCLCIWPLHAGEKALQWPTLAL